MTGTTASIEMIVAVNILGSTAFFDLPEIDKYHKVAAVTEDCLDYSYILCNFVENSVINNQRVGVLGIGGVKERIYNKIEATSTSLSLRLTDEKLASITEPEFKTTVILHFV